MGMFRVLIGDQIGRILEAVLVVQRFISSVFWRSRGNVPEIDIAEAGLPGMRVQPSIVDDCPMKERVVLCQVLPW